MQQERRRAERRYPTPKFLTVGEAAVVLRASKTPICDAVAAGQIRAYRTPRILIQARDVDACFRKQPAVRRGH